MSPGKSSHFPGQSEDSQAVPTVWHDGYLHQPIVQSPFLFTQWDQRLDFEACHR